MSNNNTTTTNTNDMSNATTTKRTVEIKRLTHAMTSNWLKMSYDEIHEHMDFMEQRRKEVVNDVVSRFMSDSERIGALGLLLFMDNALNEMKRCSAFIGQREMDDEFENETPRT